MNFFTPNHEYGHCGEPGQQVQDITLMVKSLHEAGIEVILDVVYDHTAEDGFAGREAAS